MSRVSVCGELSIRCSLVESAFYGREMGWVLVVCTCSLVVFLVFVPG